MKRAKPPKEELSLLAAAKYCVQFGNDIIAPTLRKRLNAAIDAYEVEEAQNKRRRP